MLLRILRKYSVLLVTNQFLLQENPSNSLKNVHLYNIDIFLAFQFMLDRLFTTIIFKTLVYLSKNNSKALI